MRRWTKRIMSIMTKNSLILMENTSPTDLRISKKKKPTSMTSNKTKAHNQLAKKSTAKKESLN